MINPLKPASRGPAKNELSLPIEIGQVRRVLIDDGTCQRLSLYQG
jgi:hypothetical protein